MVPAGGLTGRSENVTMPFDRTSASFAEPGPVDQVIRLVGSLHPGVFAAVGAVYLFWGWQLRRLTLMMAAAVVGGMAASIAAEACGHNGLVPAMVGGALFALLAVPLQKLSVFVLGGIGGAGFGLMSLAYYQSEVVLVFWMLFGFLLVGGLAVRFFRPMVILGTSITGAWSIAHALALFLGRIPPDSSGLDMFAYPKSYLLLFVCLFLLGILSQCWLHEETPRPATAAPPQEPGGEPRQEGGQSP